MLPFIKPMILLILTSVLAHAPKLAESSQASEDKRQIICSLKAFLEDPVINFPRFKAIANPCELITLGYELNLSSKGSRGLPLDFIDQLYGRHFQDVDEKKMQIVVYLYRQLRSCYGDIVNKTIATIGLNPTIFISVLEREPDWESIVEGLSLEWESFLPILGRLGDTEFAQEVKNQAFRAHEGRDQKIEIIAAFLNDPVMLFDKVRTWDDIGFWIGQYGDRLYTEGRLTEPIIDVFIRTHFQEIDEKKIEILIHLVLRCRGFIGEMIADETAKIFMLHPSMFIKVLERTEDWQRVVDEISMLSWNNFQKGLMKIGDTDFEKSLRKYINDKRIV